MPAVPRMHPCPRCKTLVQPGHVYCCGCRDLFFRHVPAQPRSHAMIAIVVLAALAIVGLNAIRGEEVARAPRSLAPTFVSPGAIQEVPSGR